MSEKKECETCKGKGKILSGKTRETAKLIKCRACGGDGYIDVEVLSSKEFGKITKEIYLDGRHWNRGGGLNK